MKDRIKQIRQKTHLSQTAFGEAIGVSLSSVQKWESGQNTPTKQVQYVICDKFNISPGWLETGAGEMVDENVETDIELITRAMEGQSEAKKQLLRIVANMPDELLSLFLERLKNMQKDS